MVKYLNRYYYLAPLWFLVEIIFWPGFRAGIIFGNSTAGIAAFYAVETGIAVAVYRKSPYADFSAFAENMIYLIFAFKYIIFAPLDIAMNLESNSAGAGAMIAGYRASLPGIIFSAAHAVFNLKRFINGGFKLPADGADKE